MSAARGWFGTRGVGMRDAAGTAAYLWTRDHATVLSVLAVAGFQVSWDEQRVRYLAHVGGLGFAPPRFPACCRSAITVRLTRLAGVQRHAIRCPSFLLPCARLWSLPVVAGQSKPGTDSYPREVEQRVRDVRSAPRYDARIVGAVTLGLLCAIVGIVIGLRMALHATVVDCPDGTYFPAGTTDLRCFAHNHAGVGAAIILISIMLAVVILLCGFVAKASVHDPRQNR